MSLQIKKRSLAPGVVDYFDNQIDSVDGKVNQEILDRQAAITAVESLVSDEESRALTAEGLLSNRVSPMEEILEFEKMIAYNDNAQIYADAQPGSEDITQRPGWYFKNTTAGQKANWYFFDGANQANISLGDFSAYAVMTFDSVSPVRHPILAVYTMPTGTNDIAPGFAHSKVVYSSMSITPVAGKKYLVYFGQNPAIHPELPRIQLAINSSLSVGEKLSTERVLTTSFGSDSGSAVNTVQFLVESFGVNSPAFKAEAELKIKVASLKALQDSISGTVQQSYVDLQDSSILASAQAYADQKVANFVNSAPETLDTLNELAAALGNDANFSATVLAQIGSVDAKADQEILDRQSGDASTLLSANSYTDAQIATIPAVDLSNYYNKTEIDSKESTLNQSINDLDAYAQDVRSDVDSLEVYAQDIRSDLDAQELEIASHESRLDALEILTDGPSFSNGSVIVSAELGFIDLDKQYIKLMSCAVGRLMVHEGEDFTVSVVDGKTRLTWIGSLVNPDGAEAIETGDKVFFVGAY